MDYKEVENVSLNEFITKSKELLDFTRCSVLVTKYKEDKFDFRDYSIKLISLEKKIMSKNDDVVALVFKIATDKYFDGTNIKEAVSQAIDEVEILTGRTPKDDVIKVINGGD